MNHIRNLCAALLIPILLVSCAGKDKDAVIFSSIDDLAGRKVAVCVGSTQDQFLEKHYPEVLLFRTDGCSDIIAPLLSGQVDAAMSDDLLINLIAKGNPDLCVIGEGLMEEQLGFGFKDDTLRTSFNDFLRGLDSSGELEAIKKRWSEDDGTTLMPSLDLSGPNGKLIVMGDPVMPLLYLRNEEYCGMDIEILSRFCESEGYALEVQTASFASSLLAISSKKVDIVCGGITITEERKQRIAFGDSYYTSCSKLLVRKENSPTHLSSEAGSKENYIQRLKRSFHNNIVKEDRYKLILDGLRVTLVVSVLSVLLGTLLAGLLCFMKLSRNKLLVSLANLFTGLLKGIPQLVLLLLMFYVVLASTGLDGVVVATITFSMSFGAGVSEIFRTAIIGVDKGQTEAGLAMGFSKAQTFAHIVAPQAFRRAMSLFKGEIVSLVKATSIIGYIAVQDLTKAGDIIRSRTFDAYFPLILVAAIYFLLAYLLTFSLNLIESKNGSDN